MCATPRCDGAPDGEGERFCPPCRERLDRVRREIDSGKSERLHSTGMRKRMVYRSCAVFECSEWAKPGERHCLHHIDTLGA